MTRPGGTRQVDATLDSFNYLLQPGSQEPIEYIPVDDFFDEVLRSRLRALLSSNEPRGVIVHLPDRTRIASRHIRVYVALNVVSLAYRSTWTC